MSTDQTAGGEGGPSGTGPEWSGLAGAFALGVLAMVTQAVLLREGLSAAAGHELMFGVVLTGWLAGQALCLALAWGLGRRIAPEWALLVAGVSAPVSLVVMRFTVSAVTPATGTLPRLAAVAPGVVLACLPASFGIALAVGSVYHAVRRGCGERALVAVYAAETLGFLVGGAAWTFLLAGYISHVQALLSAPGAVMLCSLPMVLHRRWWPGFATLASAMLTAGWLAAPALATLVLPGLPAGLDQVAYQDGQRARWQVVEYGGETSFYRDGRLLHSTGQPELAAQSALLPLAQVLPPTGAPAGAASTDPVRVLHIGLRPPGVEEACTAVSGVEVTWLDGDGDYLRLLGEATGRTPTPAAPGSPAALLARRGNGLGWDLVVLAVGPPSSPHSAWAYDRAFLQLVRHGLADDGVIALGLAAEDNYNADSLRLVHGRVRQSLTGTFAGVVVTPPGPVWYFAGNPGAGLTLDPVEIEARLAARGVTTPWLSRWVLADRLDPQRAGGWMQPAAETTPAAGVPLALAGLRMELAGNDPALAAGLDWLAANRAWLGITVFILLLLPALAARDATARGSPRGFPPVVLAGYAGFTCLAAEVVLAWRLQALTGELYWLAALLAAVVLGGLFLGTVLAGSGPATLRPAVSSLFVLLLATATLTWLGGYHPVVIAGIWLLAGLVPVATGVVLGRALGDPQAAPWRLYAADLTGSALAALGATVGLLCWGAGWCALALAPVWVIVAVRWRGDSQ